MIEYSVTFLRTRIPITEDDARSTVIAIPAHQRLTLTIEIRGPLAEELGLTVVETFKLITTRTHDARGSFAPAAVYLLDDTRFESELS